jgi:hypothetical protein
MNQRITSHEQIDNLLNGDIIIESTEILGQERYRIVDISKEIVKLLRIENGLMIKVFCPEEFLCEEWYLEEKS